MCNIKAGASPLGITLNKFEDSREVIFSFVTLHYKMSTKTKRFYVIYRGFFLLIVQLWVCDLN